MRGIKQEEQKIETIVNSGERSQPCNWIKVSMGGESGGERVEILLKCNSENVVEQLNSSKNKEQQIIEMYCIRNCVHLSNADSSPSYQYSIKC